MTVWSIAELGQKQDLFGGYPFIYKRRKRRRGRDRGGPIGIYFEESQWGLLKD